MFSTLLFAAVTLFVLALPVLVYVLVNAKTFNLQQVWSLAVSGNRAARLYMGFDSFSLSPRCLRKRHDAFSKTIVGNRSHAIPIDA